MKDYNFEVLKIKKDKSNYFYRLFIMFSLVLIVVFVCIIFINSKDRIVSCSNIFTNDAGEFNYYVSIKLTDNKISSIKGRQIVDLNIRKATLELYDLLNKDIENNKIDGLVMSNSLEDNIIILSFKADKVNYDNLNAINNLLGVSNITLDLGVSEIIYNYEYQGFKCK